MTVRRRTFDLALDTEIEGRASGYITTFHDPYSIGARTREIILPTTFDLSRAIPLMYQHDHGSPPVGVAVLRADDKGIIADITYFTETERGRAAYLAQKSGAMREFSVGFTAQNDDITVTRSGEYTDEVINRGDLLEASLVLRGANPNTETLEVREAPSFAADAACSCTACGCGAMADAPAEDNPAYRAVPAEWLDRLAEPHIRALVAGLRTETGKSD